MLDSAGLEYSIARSLDGYFLSLPVATNSVAIDIPILLNTFCFHMNILRVKGSLGCFVF